MDSAGKKACYGCHNGEKKLCVFKPCGHKLVCERCLRRNKYRWMTCLDCHAWINSYARVTKTGKHVEFDPYPNTWDEF